MCQTPRNQLRHKRHVFQLMQRLPMLDLQTDMALLVGSGRAHKGRRRLRGMTPSPMKKMATQRMPEGLMEATALVTRQQKLTERGGLRPTKYEVARATKMGMKWCPTPMPKMVIWRDPGEVAGVSIAPAALQVVKRAMLGSVAAAEVWGM